MKNWQIQLVLHQQPGQPVIMTGVVAPTPSEAYGLVLRRLGPVIYGADVELAEIPSPGERRTPREQDDSQPV